MMYALIGLVACLAFGWALIRAADDVDDLERLD
jgi:hypothetical protein